MIFEQELAEEMRELEKRELKKLKDKLEQHYPKQYYLDYKKLYYYVIEKLEKEM